MTNDLQAAREPRGVMTLATELKTGDVFEFEGKLYVHVFGVFDDRHTVVSVVAWHRSAYIMGNIDHDVVFLFDRETKMLVTDKFDRRHLEVIRVFDGKRVSDNA